MKKIRMISCMILLSFFCGAGVAADVPYDPVIVRTEESSPVILYVIILALILSAAGVAVWILVRSRRRR